MTPCERLLNVFPRRSSGRPPVAAFCTAINTHMMTWAGEDFASCRGSPEQYAKLASAPWEVYGIGNLKIPFDMTIEPELLGAGVDMGGPLTLPQVRTHPFAQPADFAIPAKWQDNERVRFTRHVLALLRKRYDKVVPVCHLCVGPFALANMLFGFDNLLVWMITEEDTYRRAMDRTTAFCVDYCRMLEAEGADIIMFGEASASGDLISGEQYAALVAPYHSQLAQAVHAPNVVHICGNITGHLPSLAGTGFGGISFDHKTDVAAAVRHCKGKLALVGYVPIPILAEGAPAQVSAAVTACIDAGVDILHAGCAWPPSVPDANARAFAKMPDRCPEC